MAKRARLLGGTELAERTVQMVGSSDDASISPGEVQRRWRDEIRFWPPRRKRIWLQGTEARLGLGLARCQDLAESLADDTDRVSKTVPSATWFEAWDGAGEAMPAGDEHQVRLGAVRMVLCRAKVRFGDGPAHRRWTPPIAADTEDFLDCMTELQAALYQHPPSPSAMIINRMGQLKAREQWSE